MRTELLEDVKHLPVEDRIELAEAIWDSIAEDASPEELPLPESHRIELDRRLADLEAGTIQCRSWDEVRSRLERQR